MKEFAFGRASFEFTLGSAQTDSVYNYLNKQI